MQDGARPADLGHVSLQVAWRRHGPGEQSEKRYKIRLPGAVRADQHGHRLRRKVYFTEGFEASQQDILELGHVRFSLCHSESIRRRDLKFRNAHSIAAPHTVPALYVKRRLARATAC